MKELGGLGGTAPDVVDEGLVTPKNTTSGLGLSNPNSANRLPNSDNKNLLGSGGGGFGSGMVGRGSLPNNRTSLDGLPDSLSIGATGGMFSQAFP